MIAAYLKRYSPMFGVRLPTLGCAGLCVLVQSLSCAQEAFAEGVVLRDEIQRQEAPRLNGQVLGADPAQDGVWPVTFTFQTIEKNCTATAVGRWVILLAAHCVTKGHNLALIGNSLLSKGRAELDCEQHPDYVSNSDISADYALCLLTSPLTDPPVGFERITKRKEITEPGRKLLLLGYGCTQTNGEKDFGNLYEGYATTSLSSFGPNYITTTGGAAVCTGDSGGGIYWIEDEANVRKTRLLVGISSRGNIATKSWISSTSSASFLTWADDWIQKAQAKQSNAKILICGLDKTEDHCRTE
jgi:hypothetical protein